MSFNDIPRGPAALEAALDGCSERLRAQRLVACAKCREHHSGWCRLDHHPDATCPAGALWRTEEAEAVS